MPYIKTLNLSFQNQLEYKVNFIMSFIFKLIPVLVNILIWMSITIKKDSNMNNNDIITYYCISLFTTNMVACFIQKEIANDINNGDICKYLLRPINYFWYYFFKDVAHRISFLLFGIIPIIYIFYMFKNYLILAFDFRYFILFLFAMLIGYFINFLFCFIISELSFYFTNVNVLFSSFDVLKNLLSGTIFPLNLLSTQIIGVLLFLPFSYIGYLPTIILQQKYTIDFLTQKLIIGVVWILILYLISHLIWEKGIKQYSTFGG